MQFFIIFYITIIFYTIILNKTIEQEYFAHQNLFEN